LFVLLLLFSRNALSLPTDNHPPTSLKSSFCWINLSGKSILLKVLPRESFKEADGKNSVQHFLDCCFYYWDLSRKGRILRWLYWKLYWVFIGKWLLLLQSKGVDPFEEVYLSDWETDIEFLFSDHFCCILSFHSREAKLISYQFRIIWLKIIINLINEWKKSKVNIQ